MCAIEWIARVLDYRFVGRVGKPCSSVAALSLPSFSLLSPSAAYEIYNLNHSAGDERLEASAAKGARRKNSFDAPLREEIFARRFTDVRELQAGSFYRWNRRQSDEETGTERTGWRPIIGRSAVARFFEEELHPVAISRRDRFHANASRYTIKTGRFRRFPLQDNALTGSIPIFLCIFTRNCTLSTTRTLRSCRYHRGNYWNRFVAGSWTAISTVNLFDSNE